MKRKPGSGTILRLLGLCGCCACPILSGCAESAVIAAAGVTAGFGLAQGRAEAFINGELKAARMVPVEKAMQAVFVTLDELQVPVKIQRRGQYDAYIMGKAVGGPEVKVHLKAKSPLITKVEIRIGLMGDQAVSRLVLSRIDHHLGIPQPILPIEESPFFSPPTTSPAATQPDTNATTQPPANIP